MFLKFDKLAKHHHVEKIKTIGDCYVAATGLWEVKDNHTFNFDSPWSDESNAALGFEMKTTRSNIANHAVLMIRFSLDIHRVMLALNAEFDLNLVIRSGVHTGHVVGGVIGSKRLAFDIWGETVDLANAFETKGIGGRVHCSEATRNRASTEFVFEKRKELIELHLPEREPIKITGFLVLSSKFPLQNIVVQQKTDETFEHVFETEDDAGVFSMMQNIVDETSLENKTSENTQHANYETKL